MIGLMQLSHLTWGLRQVVALWDSVREVKLVMIISFEPLFCLTKCINPLKSADDNNDDIDMLYWENIIKKYKLADKVITKNKDSFLVTIKY